MLTTADLRSLGLVASTSMAEDDLTARRHYPMLDAASKHGIEKR